MSLKNTITKLTALLSFWCVLGIGNVQAQSAEEGEKLFNANCVSCHAINEQVVGPALKNVHERRDEAWLISWIRNSQEMVKSGDEQAVAIYNEYNQSVMTSFTNLSDGEIKSILAYVKEASAAAPAPVAASATTATGAPIAAPSDSLKSSINWMIFIVVLLLIIVIALVFDIVETVGKVQGKQIIPWNKVNAALMLLFVIVGMGFAIWEFVVHAPLTLFSLGSASEHGEQIDSMFYITLILTGIVFVITQILLFWFAFRYKGSKKKKALFYPDNHKLEYIWTIIPAIVLTVLVIGGLKAWNKTLGKTPEGTPAIEIFAYQFAWDARYPGADNTFGKSNFRLIGKVNALGVDDTDPNALDDIVTKELHLPVGEEVVLKFRAKDVIHSAYLPHFRVQMNCVPGLPTEFRFKPTVTTAEMREKSGNPNFDYILLCAKICGAAHYRMKMKVVVETPAEYKRWLSSQDKYIVDKSTTPEEETDTPGETETPQDSVSTSVTQNITSTNPVLTLASN